MAVVTSFRLRWFRAVFVSLFSLFVYFPAVRQSYAAPPAKDRISQQGDRFRFFDSIEFEHLSIEQGLSHPGVYSIIQDSDGFIWIGTTDGLNRYDGYAFHRVQRGESGSEALTESIIYALAEDRNNRIWIASVGGGLCMFDRPRGRFTDFRHRQGDPASLSHDYVYAVYEDQAGRIWAGTRRGLDQVDPVSGAFSHFIPDDQDSVDAASNQVTAIYERSSQQGILWIGTWGGGLKRFDVAQKRFTHFRQGREGPQGLGHNAIRFICELPEEPHALWIGTEGGGLEKFNVGSESFTHYVHTSGQPGDISSNFVRSMLRDRSGFVWVGTGGGGLNLFNPASKTFLSRRHEPTNSHSLSNDDVTTLFEDRSGVLWIGTRAGLNRFVPRHRKLLHFKHDPNDKHSLSRSFLYGLHEDSSGNLWIATWGGGLNKYNPATGTFTAYRHDPRNPATLRNDFVRSVYGDRAGFLWVGNSQTVLHRFDPRTGRAKVAMLFPDAPQDEQSTVNTMLEDRDGVFWVGTGKGLLQFNRKEWRQQLIKIGPVHEGTSVLNVCQDTRGIIWIGTRGAGLVRYEKSSGTMKWYSHDNNNPHRLANDIVLCIYEDRYGTMWIGTAGGGLNRLDPTQEFFTAYTTNQGLPSNTVYGVLEDKQGNLWISTTRGLAKFTPENGKCEILDIRDGLQSYDYNSGSYCKSRSGVMYFGGVNGLNVIYPDSIHDNPHVPPIALTSFKMFNTEVYTSTDLCYIRQIDVAPEEDFISFEFAALDFTEPARNMYAYMMEGFDRDWIVAGTRRYAAYTNLPPGHYVFRVKGSNSDGLWNDTGVELSIVVHPPFWKTWWFRSILVIAVLAFCYLLYRYRVSKVIAIERLRLRIAGDLHDEIGSNLSGIALEGDLAVRQSSLPAEVRSRLREMTMLARETSQSMRDIVWLINPEHDTFGDFLTKMRETADRMLIGMSHDFRTPDGMPGVSMSLETKRAIFLMYKEVLHNIVKHSRASRVCIETSIQDGRFHLKLRDDGIGFSKMNLIEGEGMKSLRRRASQAGGSMEITSEPGKGTTVEMEVRM